MRVLVVDEEIPYPLDSGKRIRTFNLLYHLAKRHELVFLCRRHEAADVSDPRLMQKAGIRVIQVDDPIRKKSGLRFYTALLANLFSRYPYVVDSHYSSALLAAIRQEVEKFRPDILHCEWTPYAEMLKPFLPAPSVVVAHNVETQIWERLAAVERNPVRRAYIRLQCKKMEKYEKDAVGRFSKVVAVSEPDRKILARWIPEERLAVVENGVDLDFFRPDASGIKSRSLVFVGSLDWNPNIDCIYFLLDEIWPKIVSVFPDANLTIVGRRPSRKLMERIRATPSAVVASTVPDVRPYIQVAAVYVVPLRAGGGSRLKILEALAMGKAVVSTTVGAEGLQVTNGENIILAETADDFAGVVARLFQDREACDRLGSAGRRLVEASYGWKGLGRKLEVVWTEAVRSDRK